MRRLLWRFAADRRGATAIEYGLIVAFLGVAVYGAGRVMAGAVLGLFQFVLDAYQAI